MSNQKDRNPSLFKAKRHVNAMLHDIADAHSRGRDSRCRYLVRHYLSSYSAKLMATYEAYRALKVHRRTQRDSLPEIALGLSPWQGSSEEVLLHFELKSCSQAFRPVMDFGIENRALQYLVLSAIRTTGRTDKRQFLTNGGRHAAINAVMNALTEGYEWVAELDINNCYGSDIRKPFLKTLTYQRR